MVGKNEVVSAYPLIKYLETSHLIGRHSAVQLWLPPSIRLQEYVCSGQIKFTFVYLNLSKIIFRNSKSEKTRANILRLAASYLRISQRKFKQWTKNWQCSQFLDFITSNVPLKIMIFSEQILFWSKFQRNNIETKRFMKTSYSMTRDF